MVMLDGCTMGSGGGGSPVWPGTGDIWKQDCWGEFVIAREERYGADG